ncbi:MAG: hypothetical protein QXM68_03095 [Candidatus Aenigmatarchaeota archaeon]|nr:hypothetical protein [Candidatus Aenigmarchaeota archaeon]
MPEDEFIKIRKKDVARFLLLIVFFAAGYFVHGLLTNQPKTQVSLCSQFCEYANLEYAFVKDNMCYCYQGQLFYNQAKNKTIIVFQAVNAGMIKNITAENGLTS